MFLFKIVSAKQKRPSFANNIEVLVYQLTAVFDGFSLIASGARASYVVDNAVSSCGDAIGVFNDIVTLRKDLLEGLTENLVLIIAEKAFFSKNIELTGLPLTELKELLFYRDLCTAKSLNENSELFEKAVCAIQEKYKMRLDEAALSVLLNQGLESFLVVATEVGNKNHINFRETIFDSWADILRLAIQETTDKYFNKEVVSFYKSIDSCKKTAKVSSDRFPPELFRYFDRLETWLSGSSYWRLDPENKRYNWWRS